ncbi:MAG: hypothetical protein IPP87_07465 [Ideonella sp.]|nr:hypothetical protein [Ideonella sp.]
MNAQQTPTIQAANERPVPGQPSRASRIGCLLAAALVTTLSLGAQLGLAQGYTAQADALMAAQRGTMVAQAAAHPQARGDTRVVCLYDALASLGGTAHEPRHQQSDTACQRG